MSPNAPLVCFSLHDDDRCAVRKVVCNPSQEEGFATVLDGTNTVWDGEVFQWPIPTTWPASAELHLHPADFSTVVEWAHIHMQTISRSMH